MVIEEIVNELDTFITKYKERKSSAEKGISLRNNIKQALIEKGIQGADTLDDSAIVERIKMLSSNGNTAVEGTQGNNSINETFAEKVIQALKENHYPFLNSEADSLEKFVEFMKKKAPRIEGLLYKPQVVLEDEGLAVSITPADGLAVKVRYTTGNKDYEEIVTKEKTISNVSKFSYRECDYYGTFGDIPEKNIYLAPYRKQLEHPENYLFSGDNNGGYSSEVAFTGLIDNSNYDIIDLSDSSFYRAIASKKVKENNSNKKLDRNLDYSLRNVTLNGTIKIGLLQDSGSGYSLGLPRLNSPALKTPPKYIVSKGMNTLEYSPLYILGKSYNLENKYNSRTDADTWRERLKEVSVTGTIIYRWDSTQNQYVFESTATLEEWLKTHPIETL